MSGALTGPRVLTLARRILAAEPGRACEQPEPHEPAPTPVQRILAAAGNPADPTAGQVRRLNIPHADYAARRLLATCQPVPGVDPPTWSQLLRLVEGAAAELARRTGLRVNALSRYERGCGGDPHLSTIRRLATALQVSASSLIAEGD